MELSFYAALLGKQTDYMEIDLQHFDQCFFDHGSVYPRGQGEGASQLRAECLIEGSDPSIEITVRFLQMVERQVLDPLGNPAAELLVTDRCHRSGWETTEHEVCVASLPNRAAALRTAGSERCGLVASGEPAGALLWRWEPLHATIEAWTERLGPALRRVRVDVANRLECDACSREQAQLRTIYSTHVFMHSPDGAFASLANPPPHLRQEAAACENEGLWPVPVGAAGDRRTILAGPIPLEDYPEGSASETGARDDVGIAAGPTDEPVPGRLRFAAFVQ
jgi:hypothetical protein